MATAKAAGVPEEVVAPIEEDTNRMVRIFVPRNRDDEEDLVVWVNHRRWLVKRGDRRGVLVPECVARAIEDAERMEDYIYDYNEKHADKNGK